MSKTHSKTMKKDYIQPVSIEQQLYLQHVISLSAFDDDADDSENLIKSREDDQEPYFQDETDYFKIGLW